MGQLVPGNETVMNKQEARIRKCVQTWARTTVGDVAPGIIVVAAFRIGEYLLLLCRNIGGQETFDEVCKAQIHFPKIEC